jgi:murein DD-endopeptidase MepM/ murein hydrolase activator NlpD
VRWRGLRVAVPAVAAASSLIAGAVVVGASAGAPSAAPGAAPAGLAAAVPAADPLRQKKNRVDNEIGQVQETLEGASKDVIAAAVAVQVAQKNLAAAQAAGRAAQAALKAAVAHDQQVAANLAVAEAQQAKAERQLAAGRAQQEDTRSQLGRMAREAYMGSGLSGLAVALGADSPDEFADRVSLAGIALRSQGGVVDELAVQQAELVARGAKVQAVADQVTELKRQSAAAVAARRAAEKAAAAAAARTAALLAAEQAALTVAQSKVAAEKARLASLQSEQSKLQAMLAARARAEAEAEARRRRAGGGNGEGGGDGGGGAPTSGGGYLSHAANGPITSPFGLRYHPILHIWRLHSGIDFGIPCGTPVYAAAAGTIISAGWAGGYGNRVVIDHGMVRGVDLATTYNHLTSIVAGGHVRRGQLIAYSGTTGLSTGCHLHFETLVNGTFVNPMNWL